MECIFENCLKKQMKSTYFNVGNSQQRVLGSWIMSQEDRHIWKNINRWERYNHVEIKGYK